MFCPECRAEYRQGFTRCSDCDVDLVPSLPQEIRTENPDTPLAVWSGDDPVAFGVAIAALKNEGIPAIELSEHDPWGRIADIHGPLYRLLVRGGDATRADAAIKSALAAGRCDEIPPGDHDD